MENKFDINSEEVKRILSLHEGATKKQYLNVISEQNEQSYTLGSDVVLNDNYKIPKGTKFNVIKYGVLGAKASGGNKYSGEVNIQYTCSKGKFRIDRDASKSELYDVNGDLTKRLSPLCHTNSMGSVKAAVGKKITTTKQHPFKDSKGTTYYIPINTTFNWDGNNATGSITTGFGDKLTFTFSCPATFKVNNVGIIPTSTYSSTFFNEQFCSSKVSSTPNIPTEKVLEPAVVSKTKNQPTRQQYQQQFVQQVGTNNKLIQTSLGVQQPTGQLTTADIDAIMTKLG